jgi:hypothetical protein
MDRQAANHQSPFAVDEGPARRHRSAGEASTAFHAAEAQRRAILQTNEASALVVMSSELARQPTEAARPLRRLYDRRRTPELFGIGQFPAIRKS